MHAAEKIYQVAACDKVHECKLLWLYSPLASPMLMSCVRSRVRCYLGKFALVPCELMIWP